MFSPEEVKNEAKRKEKENLRFRTFLKNRVDPDDLDRQFHALHSELFAKYDCAGVETAAAHTARFSNATK